MKKFLIIPTAALLFAAATSCEKTEADPTDPAWFAGKTFSDTTRADTWWTISFNGKSDYYCDGAFTLTAWPRSGADVLGKRTYIGTWSYFHSSDRMALKFKGGDGKIFDLHVRTDTENPDGWPGYNPNRNIYGSIHTYGDGVNGFFDFVSGKITP